jgi:membrane protease YdiL (CAAX protease family)
VSSRSFGVWRPRSSSFDSQPLLSAVLLALLFVAVAAGGTLALGALAPSLQGKDRDLLVEIVLAVLVVAIIAAVGWRREVGLTGPSEWRHASLLVVPVLVVLIPFLGGFKGAADGTLGLLLVGYTVNSIAEDGMFSGILPRVLQSRGLVVAVLGSAALFGLAHFGNLLSRPDQSFAITAAQAVGVFTAGIGFIAIRLVTRSLIAVMVVHGLFDLFLQLGGMPSILANVIESTLLLIVGIWMLRRYRAEIADLGWR